MVNYMYRNKFFVTIRNNDNRRINYLSINFYTLKKSYLFLIYIKKK